MVWITGHHRRNPKGGQSWVDRHHRKIKHRKSFKQVQTRIAERLEGTSVPKKYQWRYGKRYSKSESQEASKRITGRRWRR